MAILNVVVVPAKALKDGRHKVRISVAHNGETRYIVTNITIDSIKEFKNGSVVKRPDASILNTKLRGLLQRYQDVIDEIECINGLTCPEIVYMIKNAGNEKKRTLLSIYKEYIENANIKPNSYRLYTFCWKGITEYLNEKMIVGSMTHATILGLDKYLRSKNLSPTTIRCYVTFLTTLINYAKRCGYVQFRINPFNGYELPKGNIRQSWLSVDEVKKIRDADISKSNVAKCRDLFMLSYYLGGINIVDLININFNEQSDVIHYERTKTENRHKMNKFVEFRIPEEAKAIIRRYKGSSGYLNINANQKSDHCHSFFQYNMPKLANATGIKKLYYYSARKSFSQHAFDIGINTDVIDYILGHKVDKGESCLFAYIFVTPEMATEALRKVLDNLK